MNDHRRVIRVGSGILSRSLGACLLFGIACTPNSDRGTAQEHLATIGAPLTASGLSSAELTLKVSTNSCSPTEVQDFFEIINNGATPIALSDIKVRLWAYDTSGVQLTSDVKSGGCIGTTDHCTEPVQDVSSTVTHFSPSCGPDTTHQANWEITIANTASGTLQAG